MNKVGKVVVLTLSVFAIGAIDYSIVADLSLSICYLVPLILGTRYVGKNFGIFLTIASTIAWYIAEDVAKQDLHIFLLCWNTLVRLIVSLTVVYLLDALKNAYEREKKLARIDGLTQIYNRRYFLDILEMECKRAVRYHRYLTLAYFDVDNFKLVNDRYGHQKGDRLLILIADTVKNITRETDVVARLGGDEFALLLPETDYQAAQRVLARVHHKLAEAAAQQAFDVGFSMGAVTFRELPSSIEQMLEQVDKLMYQVKAEGKNRLNHQLSSLNHQSDRPF